MLKVVDYQGNPIEPYSNDEEKTKAGLPFCYRPDSSFVFLGGDSSNDVFLSRTKPR